MIAFSERKDYAVSAYVNNKSFQCIQPQRYFLPIRHTDSTYDIATNLLNHGVLGSNGRCGLYFLCRGLPHYDTTSKAFSRSRHLYVTFFDSDIASNEKTFDRLYRIVCSTLRTNMHNSPSTGIHLDTIDTTLTAISAALYDVAGGEHAYYRHNRDIIANSLSPIDTLSLAVSQQQNSPAKNET